MGWLSDIGSAIAKPFEKVYEVQKDIFSEKGLAVAAAGVSGYATGGPMGAIQGAGGTLNRIMEEEAWESRQKKSLAFRQADLNLQAQYQAGAVPAHAGDGPPTMTIGAPPQGQGYTPRSGATPTVKMYAAKTADEENEPKKILGLEPKTLAIGAAVLVGAFFLMRTGG